MKRTYMSLAIIAALSLTACGGSDDKDMVKDKDTSSTGSIKDESKDQQKDKNKENQGQKSSSSASKGSSHTGHGIRQKAKVPPAPRALRSDARPLPVNNEAQLIKQQKPEGDGSIVVHWDNKFKAMHSVNRNLSLINGDKNVDSASYNKDGTRLNLTTSWNKISITAPNTIVGHDGQDLDDAQNIKDGKKVGRPATLDLLKAQRSPQRLIIELEDGTKVPVQYKAEVLNLGREDGNYVAQAVHVYGVEGKDKHDYKHLDMAYVYGVKTPDQFDKVENLPEKATYEGIANYMKHDSEKKRVYKGTASFDVEFANRGSSPEATITTGKISIPDAGINFTSDDLKTKGKTSFEIKNKPFGHKGNFAPQSTSADDIRLRGRFYGKNAQYLGGAFYNKEGAGTFFTGDKKRGGEIK